MITDSSYHNYRNVMFSQASVILFTVGWGVGVCIPLGRHPPHPRRPLLRTVRILLECILVLETFHKYN